ncbi:MAG TPA: RagB/SusD family nutrient uptake outer membrane protein [Flavitalea sp.]|nr:RagB/SusD family nutrient uptake outer membrane protein [Flavitalea sp.]
MKTYKWFIVACLILVGASCKKYLDIKPLDSLSPVSFYSTESELDFALTGVYGMLRNIYNNTRFKFYGLCADEGYATENTAVAPMAFNAPASHNNFNDEWNILYRAVYRANALLENLDRNPALNPARVSQIKGEALFLRGYFYLLLVQHWGGVPLILEPASSPFDILVPRSSVQEVYQQIISDLETAEPLVPSITSLGFGGRASKSAVRGMLARVNLHMAGYPLNDKSRLAEVSKWAKMVMDDPEAQHALNPSYSQVFINYAQDKYDIKESIFEVEFYGQVGVGNMQGYIGAAMGPNGVFGATKTLFDSYRPGDLRRDWSIANFRYVNANVPSAGKTWIPVATLANLWARRPGKFRREYENDPQGSTTSQNFPILRYSDVLLMYAEAENELDRPQNAIDAVNQVRRRAQSSGIKSIEITSGGSGYTTPPTVVFHGGGGKDAVGSAILNALTGEIAGVQFELDPVTGFKSGNSYSSEPTIEFVGGDGTGASAVAEIFTLSEADLTAEETSSKESLRNAILQERTHELGFELLRRFDLNRHQLFVEKMQDVAAQIAIDVPTAEFLRKFVNVSERDALWPIPQNEITLNPLVTQNPGF